MQCGRGGFGLVSERGYLFLVTTSHRPTQRVRSFAKDLASVLPRAVKLNRGKRTLRDLYYDAVGLGAKRIVVVNTWKGNPGSIDVYRVSAESEGLEAITRLVLRGVRLRRELPGSQKVFGVERLGVYPGGGSSEVYKLVDVLSEAFMAKTVVDEELFSRFDVVAMVEERGGVFEVRFICGGTGRPCGPQLRVGAVKTP